MDVPNSPSPRKDVPTQQRECSPTDGVDPFGNDRTRRLEKSLVRKLDLTLMPIVWLLYMLKNLDKGNIS